MNPHLNHLVTQHNTAEMLRRAEHARLAGEARADDRPAEPVRVTARVIVRLRLWLAKRPTATAGEQDEAIATAAALGSPEHS